MPTDLRSVNLRSTDLRSLKHQAHLAFDQLWKSGLISRDTAYAKLALLLSIRPEQAHFGSFDEQQLRLVIDSYGPMRITAKRPVTLIDRKISKRYRREKQQLREAELEEDSVV